MPESQHGKGFLRNFVGVSLGNYGAIALSFALNVILTWRLGAEQFGRLALLVMAAQLLGCFVSLVLQPLGMDQQLPAPLIERQVAIQIRSRFLEGDRLPHAFGLRADPLEVEHGI